MNIEKLFEEFLENVKKELPESYRARQLEVGGVGKDMVYKFETKFLKEPFKKAFRKFWEQIEEANLSYDGLELMESRYKELKNRFGGVENND